MQNEYSSSSFDYYETLLMKKQSIRNTKFSKIVNEHIVRSKRLYTLFFDKADKFILHGDLHRFNILEKNTGYCAIDPIGIIAPVSFEYVRFIGTELLLCQNPDAHLMKLLQFFDHFSKVDDLLVALYIDCVFRLHNSFSECIDDDHAQEWINLLSKLYPIFKNNIFDKLSNI